VKEALFCCDLVCLALARFAGRGGGALFAEAFFPVGFFIRWFRLSSGSIVGGAEAVKFRNHADSVPFSFFTGAHS
jgi:hypothetical protein